MTAAPSSAVDERRGRRLAPIQTNFSRPTATSRFDRFPRLWRTATGGDAPPSTATTTTTTSGDSTPCQRPADPDQFPLPPQPSEHPLGAKRQNSRTSLYGLFLRRHKSDSRLTAQVNKDPSSSSTRKPFLPSHSPAAAVADPVPPLETPISRSMTAKIAHSSSTPAFPPVSVVSSSTNSNGGSRTQTRPRNGSIKSAAGNVANNNNNDNNNNNNNNNRPAIVPNTADRSYWKPPPLFQAYPQAIKHGCLPLPAPASLAESILRRDKTRDNPENANDENGGAPLSSPPTSTEQQHNDSSETATITSVRSRSSRRRDGRTEPRHHRSSSGNNNNSNGNSGNNSIPRMEWAQKVFVLATSGYLLQYAGEGRYDRLPEKMMKLGPKSVAFASDAIPGKYWVLQVTRYFEEDSTTPRMAAQTSTGAIVDGSSETLFSRLGFARPLVGPRMARSLLLVFDSPRDMHSWLVAVRAEIETRGGTKYSAAARNEDAVDAADNNNNSHRMLPPTPRLIANKGGGPNQLSDLRRRSQQMAAWDNDSATVTSDQSIGSYPSSSEAEALLTSTDTSSISRTDNNSDHPSSTATRGGTSMTQADAPSSRLSRMPSRPTVHEATDRCTSPSAPNFSVPSFRKKLSVQTPNPGIPPTPKVQPTPSSSSSSSGPTSTTSPKSNAAAKRRSFFPPVSTRNSSIRFMEKKGYNNNTTTPTSKISSLVRKGSTDMLSSSTSHDSSLRRMALSTSQESVVSEGVNGHTNGTRTKTAATEGSKQQRTSPTRLTLQANNTPSSSSLNSNSTGGGGGGVSPTTRSNNKKMPRHQNMMHNFPSPSPSSLPQPPWIKNNGMRRKSLPALSVGPPSAPPPNCPLPEIPHSVLSPPPPAPAVGALEAALSDGWPAPPSLFRPTSPPKKMSDGAGVGRSMAAVNGCHHFGGGGNVPRSVRNLNS